MNKLLAKRKNQKGQAGIEFIAVMVVIFFFLFFFLSISILFVISDYIEYATFMAARTYKSGASGPDKQFENAQIVFDSYMDKIQGIAGNFSIEASAAASNNVQTSGVVANYNMNIYYFPPLFLLNNMPAPDLDLTAEAYLGRDPSFEECSGFFTGFATNIIGTSNENYVTQMYDNGC